jgi:hypothetical protein
MAERDSRGMIRTSLHVPYRPKALNLTLPPAPIRRAHFAGNPVKFSFLPN